MRILDLPPFFRPSVSLRNKSKLPPKPGIYYAIQWWKPLKPLYVGMSGNLRARWNSRNYGEHHHYSALARRFGVRLHYRITRTRSAAERLEAIEIRRYRPPLNKRLEPLRKDVLRDIADFCTDLGLIGAVLLLVVAIVRVLK